MPTAENTQGHRFSLWNPKYFQSRAVHIEPLKKVSIINSSGTLTEIESGETIKENYTIYPYQEIQKGEYKVSKTLEIDGETYRPEIRYRIWFKIR
ncbi:MAG: hypothetical protein ABEK16_05860 [Candidatus Nanohalobium sp.]